jgi:hypothetical protein
MDMNVVQPADSGDLAAPQDAARHGRAAAMSRRRALAAGRSALAPTDSTPSTSRGMVVAADGVPPARLARAFSMQRRRQLTQGKAALNGAGTPAFVVYRGGAG